MKLTSRELGTVLAALRTWQLEFDPPGIILDIATNGGEFEPLDEHEIDDLCERLNR